MGLFPRSLAMVKYAKEPANAAKSCKTKGSDLRVHFKNTREAAQAIKGMHLNKAVAYMKAVIAKERCIPFNRFSGSIGRTAQTKEFKSPTSKGRWPEKSCHSSRHAQERRVKR